MTENERTSFRRKVVEAAARLVRSLREQVPECARPDPLFRYLLKLSAMPSLFTHRSPRLLRILALVGGTT